MMLELVLIACALAFMIWLMFKVVKVVFRVGVLVGFFVLLGYAIWYVIKWVGGLF